MANEIRMQIRINGESNPDLYIYLSKIKSSRRRAEALQNLALKGMIYGASPQLTSTGKTILVDASKDKLNINKNEKQSLEKDKEVSDDEFRDIHELKLDANQLDAADFASFFE